MESDFEQLLSLWESNFGDERSYIEQFFAAYKDKMKVQVLRIDSRIVSSCYLLPAFIRTENGTEKKVWYLYALSTRKEDMGKGYASRLLRETREDYFLVPAKGVEDFYVKRGLKKWLCEEECEVAAEECADAEISIVLAEEIISEYEVVRNESLEVEGYLRWDYEALQYALKEHECCGGKILRIRQGDEVVFVLFSQDEEKNIVMIKEITAKKSRWEEYAALTAGYVKANKAVIPGKTVMVSKNIEVKAGQGYFGLTLG